MDVSAVVSAGMGQEVETRDSVLSRKNNSARDWSKDEVETYIAGHWPGLDETEATR